MRMRSRSKALSFFREDFVKNINEPSLGLLPFHFVVLSMFNSDVCVLWMLYLSRTIDLRGDWNAI